MPRLSLVTLLLLALLACSRKFPVSSEERLPFGGGDTLFLSPLVTGEGGNFVMEKKLAKSHGDASAYIRVWKGFLGDELAATGRTLMLPLLDDSTARASFHCPMTDAAWQELYGGVPGDNSRVLLLERMELVALKRNWFERFLITLNLLDTSQEEWGYLQTDYSVYDMASDAGSGARRLVSREPDNPWISNRMDRAGRLMIRGAKDMVRELKP